jgi:hypothetical protein
LAVQTVAPAAAEWELSGHGGHADCPVALEYVPAAQIVHGVWPPAAPYVPTGQAAEHAAALVAAPSLVFVPAGQVWHAVLTPSIKYCPAPQHTATPVGLHRLTLPWLAQVGAVSAHAAKLVLSGPYARISLTSTPQPLVADAVLWA